MINLSQALSDSTLLQKAFRHRSGSQNHNETLEFLGDAVIDLAIGDLLMEKHPHLEEGELTRWRASLVNEQSLYQQAVKLGFEKHLKLGDVEKKQFEAFQRRALASCFEAVVGVFFKEQGYAFTRGWIESCFARQLTELPNTDFHFSDFKTRFQEWAQEKKRITPTYQMIEQTCGEQKSHFTVQVLLGTTAIAEGKGSSKKQAEQMAAKCALELEGMNKEQTKEKVQKKEAEV